MYFKACGCEGVKCNMLVQYKVHWREFLDTLINFLILQKARRVPLLDCVQLC